MKLVLAAAAALTFAAPALAQPGGESPFLERSAAAVRAELPITLNDGFVVTRAEARDGTLVVLVEDRNDVAAGIGPGVAAAQLGSGLALGFCESGNSFSDQFFGQGLKLRADLLLKSGVRVEGPAIDRCPE